MNGAGPLDRARTLGFTKAAGTDPSTDVMSSLLMQQSKEEHSAHDSRGGEAPRSRFYEPSHAPLLTYSQSAHGRTRHQGPQDRACTGTVRCYTNGF